MKLVKYLVGDVCNIIDNNIDTINMVFESKEPKIADFGISETKQRKILYTNPETIPRVNINKAIIIKLS